MGKTAKGQSHALSHAAKFNPHVHTKGTGEQNLSNILRAKPKAFWPRIGLGKRSNFSGESREPILHSYEE